MKQKSILLSLIVLLMAALACSVFSGGSETSPPSGVDGEPEGNPPPEAPAANDSGNYDTEFPLPPNIENFTKMGEDGINYQTSMPLTEVVEFYRSEFAQAGYDERDIITVINNTTFSIVWDGHPSGKAIVVQGVDLGGGKLNVNMRFEDV